MSISLDEYEHVKLPNGNILLKRKIYLTTEVADLKKHDFAGSKIISGSLDGKEIDKLKYRFMINYIYTKVRIRQIKLTTMFNIVDGNRTDAGFRPIKSGISIQGVSSTKAVIDILTQCIIYDISLDLSVVLKNKIKLQIKNTL